MMAMARKEVVNGLVKSLQDAFDESRIQAHAQAMMKGPFGITEHVEDTARRLVRGEVLEDDRKVVIMSVCNRDRRMAAGAFAGLDPRMPMFSARTNNDTEDGTYRVSIYPDKGADILCLGLLDQGIDGHYDSVNDLPKWVQERIAILMMTDSTPPTKEVEGVGRRISDLVFWVVAPKGLV